MNIGFIGLGSMGSGVCNNLIKSGHKLLVFDSNENAINTFSQSADLAKSAVEVFEKSEITFLSLPGSVQVEEVCANFLKTNASGKTIIDISTSYPFSTRKLSAMFAEKNACFIDSPLAGSPSQAKSGELVIYVGATKSDFERLIPIFECYSNSVRYSGESGCGNIIKLVNNYFAILYGNLYAELFPAAEKFGLNPEFVYDIIGLTGVNCTPYKIAGNKIAHKNYEKAFGLNLAYKDLTYMKNMYNDVGLPCVMLDAALSMFEKAKELGFGEEDVSAVAKVNELNITKKEE